MAGVVGSEGEIKAAALNADPPFSSLADAGNKFQCFRSASRDIIAPFGQATESPRAELKSD